MNTVAPHQSTHQSSTKRRWAMIAGVATVAVTGLVGATGVTAGGSSSTSGNVTTDFDRIAPDVMSPSGNSVLQDCTLPGADSAIGWPDATASLKVRERAGESRVTVRVRHARPNTYYTVWLRLGGTDSNGDRFGGNPVTGGQATPLSPTWDLPNLLAATGSGNGTDHLTNGFRTDDRGRATFRTNLDFPVVAGAYPFQRFPNWDPTDPRLPAENPAIHPVAIAGPQGIYTFRIVSHCTDDVGHGLTSGPRELWFDWTAES